MKRAHEGSTGCGDWTVASQGISPRVRTGQPRGHVQEINYADNRSRPEFDSVHGERRENRLQCGCGLLPEPHPSSSERHIYSLGRTGVTRLGLPGRASRALRSNSVSGRNGNTAAEPLTSPRQHPTPQLSRSSCARPQPARRWV